MKTNKYISLAAVLGLSLTVLGGSSCSREMYDGEYSADGYYIGSKQVYFDQNSAADTVRNFELGLRPESETESNISLSVRYLGPISSSDSVPYAVRVVRASGDGAYLKALPERFYIPADSIRGTLTLSLDRSKVATTDTEGNLLAVLRDGQRVLVDPNVPFDYLKEVNGEPQAPEVRLPTDVVISKYDTIVLELQPIGDTQTRLGGSRRVTVTVTNAISQPFWWLTFAGVLGSYSPEKLRYILQNYTSLGQVQSVLYGQAGNGLAERIALYTHVESYFTSRGERVPRALSSYLANYR